MVSLERRFSLGLGVSLLAAFGLLFWGSVTAVRSLGEAYVFARLEHDAEALVGAFWTNPRGRSVLRQGRITPIYQQPLSGHYFLLEFADGGRLRSRSLWDESLATRPAEAGSAEVGQVSVWKAPGPGGQELLLRTAGYDKAGRVFVLTVAEDLRPLEVEIRRFQYWAAVTLTLATLVILALQRMILRRGFRALDRVRDQVGRVTRGELRRLADRGPLEVRPMTGEINRLLDQLQRRLQRSRQALGNLAHALKGPLTLLRREVDQARLTTDEKQRLNRRLARIAQLIERELKRARTAGEGAGRGFDPGTEIPDLVDALRLLYRDRDIAIDTPDLPRRRLPFDREDMLELLGNLLDNACKYARSRVSLQLSVTGEGLMIRVSDDGPGIPKQRRGALVRRGTRLDEQEPGHGLGLAIVQDLVDDYGGRLVLDEAQRLGGLQAEILLPFSA